MKTRIIKVLVYICGIATTVIFSNNLIEVVDVWFDHFERKKADSRAERIT